MAKGQKAAKRKLLENEELTRAVFGDDLFKGLGQSTKKKSSKQSSVSSSSSSSSIDFHVDREGNYDYCSGQDKEMSDGLIEEDEDSVQVPRKEKSSTHSTAVWHDDDDDDVEIDLNLTDRLKKLKKRDNNVISGTA